MLVKRFYIVAWLILSVLAVHNAYSRQAPGPKQTVSVIISPSAHARIRFGAEKLVQGLTKAGYASSILPTNKVPSNEKYILVGTTRDNLVGTSSSANPAHREGFSMQSVKNHLLITGNDPSGALYGCLELADRIAETGKLPDNLSVTDQPEMVLRGTCIGIQKPTYLPGRGVYEYPYTPETFPWLYDKKLWLQYLDSMVENRLNSLYLWNGHPFASLVRLKEYPYAVEVDEATFKKNEEMFSFLTAEADKRGIWVIQMFYNIIVSKPFAEHNNLQTQDRNRPIIPLIADYTRKSIAAFVQKYPNVGLMVALGEAMQGVGQDDIDWFTQTIIPGVKDGLKALGKTEEPPIVLRAHDTDAPSVMNAALPLYKNLYTEAKYNGEALSTYTPRGPWAELHQKLSRLGSVLIENVHIMANLEPFRYGSATFIRKCVQAMHAVHQGNGLHLYPESSYWDWPYTADKTSPRLLQIERDWIWNKAWARYAWNCHRDSSRENGYWSSKLAAVYGTDQKGGRSILEAYEQTGEIAPKLLRRFGITDGNRQTLTLGELMTQLINPYRYGLFTLLYNSEGPEGEMLIEWAEREWKREKHVGETPVQVIRDVKEHGRKAVAAIEQVRAGTNKDEFARIKNDVYCYEALANTYAEKAEAALSVLRYKYSNELGDLERALPHLEKSVAWYKKLADLTKNTYLYANSMQTQQRKIPVGGNDGHNKTWVELLPIYEQELAGFKRRIDSLKSPNPAAVAKKRTALKNAAVTITSGTIPMYLVDVGKAPIADSGTYIKDFAEELKGLNGLQLSKTKQLEAGTRITFSSDKPVHVLVGYFDSKDPRFLQPPQLETDANANDRGQAETKIARAMIISGLPAVNIHAFSFGAGTSTLTLPKGICLIAGFADGTAPLPVYDAGLTSSGIKKELDWLFE
ncbi:MAG: hypothetical protein INR73_02335 [Williamsia sp.]|nr:hypothetical protein [Williamsia sp.]